MSKLDLKSKRTCGAAIAILLVAAAMTAAFAWTADWIGSRLTSKSLVALTPPSFPPGFRRAHGKGICFLGTFRGQKEMSALSKARAFTQLEVPVIGRFSIGAGNPHAPDGSTKTVSMALLLITDDGQQWRMAMNNQPYFAVRDAEGFLAMIKATAVDSSTGKADPNRLASFLKVYPEAEKFFSWNSGAPAPSSFAGVEYNGINSFYLVDSKGQRKPVRWTMRSHDTFTAIGEEKQSTAGHDFLFDDIRQKLTQKPLYWDLIMQLAQLGDPIDNPSQPWPQDREKILAGTLEVTHIVGQSDGACRDINYDPTIVPVGVELSNDPILSARSGAYSHSFNKRISEIGYGETLEAIRKSPSMR